MSIDTAARTISVAPLSGTIGAEIRDVDLHAPLSEAATAEIRQALLDYKVIFFPQAHLDPAEHKAFAESFGELTNAHPVIPGIDEHREVFEIDYTKARELLKGRTEQYGVGQQWHTDVTFVETPPLGSILNALVIPSAGPAFGLVRQDMGPQLAVRLLQDLQQSRQTEGVVGQGLAQQSRQLSPVEGGHERALQAVLAVSAEDVHVAHAGLQPSGPQISSSSRASNSAATRWSTQGSTLPP